MNEVKAMFEALRNGVSKLTARDQTFANSLLSQLDAGRGMSDKQMKWVAILAHRVQGNNAPPPSAMHDVGDIGKVVEMLNFAKDNGRLKYPSFAIQLVGPAIRVSLAGFRARVPGSINVTSDKKSSDGRRVWFGRILANGQFQASTNIDDSDMKLVTASLVMFVKNPVAAAQLYGRLHGHCCFCSLALSDERSTDVGYGPICADHYGLPWGEAKTTKRLRLIAA